MQDLLLPSIRFAHFGVLLGLFGLTAFRVVGLRWLGDTKSNSGAGGAVIGFAVLAPVVSGLLMLLSIAAMMGQPVGEVERATLEAMISTTDFGWAFIVRMALLLTALSALFLRRRWRPVLSIAAVLYGAALATLAWSGHAAVSEGSLGLLHRLNDAVHLLAAGLWLGAIGWFLHLAMFVHRQPDSSFSAPLLVALHRFAPFGLMLVALVSVTGLANAHLIFGLANSLEVLQSGYGLMLLAKIALVGLMLFCGARNARLSRRFRLAAAVPSSSISTLQSLRISLAAEMLLGAGVIGLVAVLGLMSPVN